MSRLVKPGVYCGHVDLFGPCEPNEIIETEIWGRRLVLDLKKMEATLYTGHKFDIHAIVEVTDSYISFVNFRL